MAPVSVTVKDGTTAGRTLASPELRLESERLTARELIRARVHQEVRDHDAQRARKAFHGLVQPQDAGRHEKGARAAPHRPRAADDDGVRGLPARPRARDRRRPAADRVRRRGGLPHTDVAFLEPVPPAGG